MGFETHNFREVHELYRKQNERRQEENFNRFVDQTIYLHERLEQYQRERELRDRQFQQEMNYDAGANKRFATYVKRKCAENNRKYEILYYRKL